MAVSRRVPNQIMISPPELPPERIRADRPAVEAITPGMLVELHNDGTLGLCWGVHDSADEPPARRIT